MSARIAALLPLQPSREESHHEFPSGRPTLEEMLSDPIVRAVMEADRIDPHELAATLREVGPKLSRKRASYGDVDQR